MQTMNKTRLAIGSFVMTFVAYAHHSAAPHFDLEKTITVEGTVTRFQFVNPHGYVYFTAKGDDGKMAPWRCELAARTALERNGWTVNSIFSSKDEPEGGSEAIRR